MHGVRQDRDQLEVRKPFLLGANDDGFFKYSNKLQLGLAKGTVTLDRLSLQVHLRVLQTPVESDM